MNEVVLKIYVFSSIIIAVMDIILAMKSIKKNKTTGRFLGLACIGAAIVDVSYPYQHYKRFVYGHVRHVEYIFRKH